MKILHPTAFSQPAEKARVLALDLLNRLNGKLHIVHVQERYKEGAIANTAIDSVNPVFQEHTEESHQTEVRRILEMLKNLTPEGASNELIWGKAVKELLRIAPDYDLIVMSAHGDNPLDDYFLGGVAGRLIRRSSTPMLTVRPSSQTREVRRVLVATDFGAASKEAWRWCQQLKEKGIEIICAHIIETPSVEGSKFTFKHLNDALVEFSEGLDEGVVRDGNAIEVLPQLAQELNADVIAIGRRKHSTAIGLLMGSRADGLVRSSAIPILSIPSTKAA